jgi:predicted metal-dependent phosphoesterase TrpH
MSDGTLSPTEVVKLAKEAGLTAIALTDHDTIDGVSEAIEAGEKYGVKVVPGIEISAEYKGGDLHILGLNVDYHNEEFIVKVSVCRDSRHNRNLKMVEKMQQCGFPVTWEEMLKRFGDNSITRAHFAKYLIDEGYVKDKDEAFNKYLNPGCPCYLPRVKVSPFEAIDVIKEAGGHPVLAHPLLYKMPYDRLESVIVMLQNHGLEGIEGRYALNKVEDDVLLDKLAKRHGLKMTGGSDFHGTIKPDISIGVGKGDLKVEEEMCAWIYD